MQFFFCKSDILSYKDVIYHVRYIALFFFLLNRNFPAIYTSKKNDVLLLKTRLTGCVIATFIEIYLQRIFWPRICICIYIYILYLHIETSFLCLNLLLLHYDAIYRLKAFRILSELFFSISGSFSFEMKPTNYFLRVYFSHFLNRK